MLATRPHRPASAHAKVGTEHDAALEVQNEVLAERLDREQPAPVEPLGDALGLRPRVWGLHLEALADEDLQSVRGSMDRVALGHGFRA